MASQDDPGALRRALSAAGRALERHRAGEKAQMDRIRELAPRARAAGLTKREIADRANISRPTLDDILPREKE